MTNWTVHISKPSVPGSNMGKEFELNFGTSFPKKELAIDFAIQQIHKGLVVERVLADDIEGEKGVVSKLVIVK